MFREFKVGWTSQSKNGEKTVTSYFVSDAKDDSEVNSRPKAAAFPISQAFPDELQERRAQDYRDYLNRLVEASKQAYEQNQLINVLKS